MSHRGTCRDLWTTGPWRQGGRRLPQSDWPLARADLPAPWVGILGYPLPPLLILNLTSGVPQREKQTLIVCLFFLYVNTLSGGKSASGGEDCSVHFHPWEVTLKFWVDRLMKDILSQQMPPCHFKSSIKETAMTINGNLFEEKNEPHLLFLKSRNTS